MQTRLYVNISDWKLISGICVIKKYIYSKIKYSHVLIALNEVRFHHLCVFVFSAVTQSVLLKTSLPSHQNTSHTNQ